jgi:uncharacterized damage-inducible protein DinB
MSGLDHYKCRGARALVMLHEQYLREFVDVCRDAKANGLRLPQVEDPDYQSLDHLLRHLLRAARGYMVWCCEVLELPDPKIRKVPEANEIAEQATDYLNLVLDKWREPLAGVEESDLNKVFKSRWEVEMAVESMLEHAVVHPVRHTFQLKELMQKQTN